MRELFKQYSPYFKDYKKEFIFAIIGMIAVAVGTAGTAQIIKPTLDDVFIKKDEHMLYLIPFALFFVYFLKGAGGYVQTYFTTYIGQDVLRRLREDLLHHITKLDMEFFQKNHSGILLSRITNDITRIQSIVSEIIPQFFRDSLIVVALTGYVIYLNPKLSLYFIVIMPLALFPLAKLSKKMRKYSKMSQQSTADMTIRLEEIFSNIDVIKANSSQKFELSRFAEENSTVFKYIMKQVKVNNLTSPIMEILGSIAIGLVVFVGGKEVIDGNMTVGEFFSFSAALFMLYTPIKALSRLHNKTQDAVAANDRIKELLSVEPKITDGANELTKNINTIFFNNVFLKYDDKIALSNINFSLQKGKLYALVGDSGAGKSSLVNMLVRFYDPSGGEILLDDENINSFTLESLHDKIAFVSQNIMIFNDTIAANVAYGKEINPTKVREALTKAHAISFVDKLENGIDTVLAQRGSNLSGGQRQRIALARALYKNPDILILDEATSALDNISEREIKKAIDELKSEMITISVAHRLSSIQDADTIFVFKDGGIICDGNHESLSLKCDEYQRLISTLKV